MPLEAEKRGGRPGASFRSPGGFSADGKKCRESGGFYDKSGHGSSLLVCRVEVLDRKKSCFFNRA